MPSITKKKNLETYHAILQWSKKRSLFLKALRGMKKLYTQNSEQNNWNQVKSSNINEVIQTVFNFLLFFYEKILHAQRSTKNHQKHKKHKNATKQKHKNANKQTKIRNMLKKHLRGKMSLIRLFTFLCLRRKSLYNRNVYLTKLAKYFSALYEPKLVY